ncbi:MAG: glycosyltransferase family 4 protein [Aquisalimonadaceae bacterium]
MSANRLLMVMNNPAFLISHRLPVAIAARDAGWEVHVATPHGDAVTQLRRYGFIHHTVAFSRQGMRPDQEIRTWFRLVQLYRTIAPDVIHHVTIKPVLYGGLAARWAGVSAMVSAVSGLGYVFLASGWKAKLVRALVRRLYRLGLNHPNSRVILQNPDDRDLLIQAGALRDEQVVMIRGSGVDLQAFSATPLPSGVPIVMLPARMLWDKGVGEFVRAARLLREEGVKARFILVGDTDPGNPAAIPLDLLRAWRRDGEVEWWGHQDAMPATLSQASIVCLPSYREGLPKVLLEAAACGRPLVATDVPGCREPVIHEENGLLVPVRDCHGLADGLRTLLADRAMQVRMGAVSRLVAERDFSVDKVVAAHLDVYGKLLRERSPRRTSGTRAIEKDRASAPVIGWVKRSGPTRS